MRSGWTYRRRQIVCRYDTTHHYALQLPFTRNSHLNQAYACEVVYGISPGLDGVRDLSLALLSVVSVAGV